MSETETVDVPVSLQKNEIAMSFYEWETERNVWLA